MDTKQPGTECEGLQASGEKTVILWGQEDVLSRAVEDLLVTGTGWRLIRVTDDLDEAALTRMLAQITPDVLIVNQGAISGDVRLLIRFVQDYSKLRIITVGLENNQMEIYNKKRICIREASDLLEAIKNGASPEK